MRLAAILVMWPGSFEYTFVLSSQGGSTWSLTLIGRMFSEKKTFENVDKYDIWVTLDQGQRMTCISSCIVEYGNFVSSDALF